MPQPIRTVAIIGCGVIGASWATLFLSRGLKVLITDPAEVAEEAFKRYVRNAWPYLQAGRTLEASLAKNYEFIDDIMPRLAEVDFVQEVLRHSSCTLPMMGLEEEYNAANQYVTSRMDQRTSPSSKT